ncbi:MAG: DNA repair protein RadC [Clostridia bacterium]|nr:DNA repair protein RadC [Clostridia bacterium]
MSNEHDGHRDRLRQRFLADRNMAGFAPHEALELLLMYAIPRKDTNIIAHRLIDRFGSLHGVLEAPVEELTQVSEIGQSAALLIHMMLPLFRLYEKDRLEERPTLASTRAVRDRCAALYKGTTVEKFYLLCLDAQLKLCATELIAEGTTDQVAVYPRNIVSILLRHNASGAVLTHNHPGHLSAPSAEDIDLTQRLKAVLDTLDIELHDHVIVGSDGTTSLRQNGFLK